jgi:NIMA (never in mitosis gene a)-related kinase
VKLIDFGIAGFGEVGPTATTFTGPLTGTEEAVGTPAYMAPEVLLGTKADARADVYGMGMLLFEMLLGEYPFVSIPQMNLMQAIAYQPPPGLRLRNPRISDAAESLVLRCLSKDPAKRPDSALALQSALVGMLRS